ncbi:uncharacterized protein LOC127276823 [Leptopilina boulardi]|uniref:uncharacterized protein LOC127276823 n=1 Tax=Leptopilina boulardi TaxID=63433 RepID=UPI0021F5BAC5|nr:uncharacterized protein LOC127276823 [Leptopilina boulardi]
MKNLGLLLFSAFFFVSLKSGNSFGFIHDLISKTNKDVQGITKKAYKLAEDIEKNETLNGPQSKQQEILRIAELIENGDAPDDVKSNSKTFSHSMKIRGKQVTVKCTVYSTGNDIEGAMHIIKTTYVNSKKSEYTINTTLWNPRVKKNYYIEKQIPSNNKR